MEDSLPVLFTQSGCAACEQVRRRLTAQGITFVERNVTCDERAAKDLLATGVFGTPLLVVGEAKVLGFRPDALATLLGRPNR